jgi:sugar O-acyltransferase (sialic acid O-acetyltransferase NeuD family)
MTKDRKLILLGDSAFAEVAYEYFTHDSPYEVVAFSVEQAHRKRDHLFGRPVVPFEALERAYPPGEHDFYAALVYTHLNRLRARLYRAAKAKGYRPASYVSPRAFVWPNARLGDHCFIFEDNVIQPFVTIGDDVVLWSGNHVGHHSAIGDHCFIASHVVISGFVTVGEHCFFGVNAAVGNNVTVGRDCLIGAGAVVVRDVADNTIIKGQTGEAARGLGARAYFKVPDVAA